MRITDIPIAVLRLQYQVARLPLQLIEDQVMTRLDPETPARLAYERSFGKLDATVGGVLGAADLAERGSALVERSNALQRAVQLEAEATRNTRQADAEFQEAQAEASEDLVEAHADREQTVKQARSTALQRKRAADQTSRKRAEAAKEKSDEVAAKRKQVVQTAKQRKDEVINTAEQAKTKAARAKLADAQDTRVEAAEKIVEADQIEEWAEAEKARRS
ncbi:translation initiation factor, IF2 family protein [Mycolicibacterium goodii]|uniref:Translation initiation factor, IF2 family protein n=1 Tax=Mycolicibacterium goodii TaxID=134601 RepID=A0A0K0XD46_MYCGD|nr:translation initiation factor, IF2 family protein [Mycolicibacterium goodii]